MRKVTYVHSLSRRPAEHEISYWKKDDSEKGRDETVFWRPQTVLLDVWNQIFELIYQKADHTDDARDADGQKAETDFANVEMVNRWVYQLKDFEERIIDSSLGTYIDICECNSRIFDHDLNWLDDCIQEYL